MPLDIKKVKRYIDENLTPTLTLKEIASEAKIDPADLARGFRNAYGVPVKKYIDLQLMDKLASRLQEGFAPGYIVGRELGFRSDHVFYRWVKRVYSRPYKEVESWIRKESVPKEGPFLSCNVVRRSWTEDPETKNPLKKSTKKLYQESAPKNGTCR